MPDFDLSIERKLNRSKKRSLLNTKEALNNSILELSEHILVPQEPLNKSEVP